MKVQRAGRAALLVTLAVAAIGCDDMMPERPRSEVIVGTWRAVDGTTLSLHADGSFATDSPYFDEALLDEALRVGVTMQWRYDDANDVFSLGGSYEGVFFGVEATAQWDGDDRVCFKTVGVVECEPSFYWTRV